MKTYAIGMKISQNVYFGVLFPLKQEKFEKAVDRLEITENRSLLTESGDITDTVEKGLRKFENHPIIIKIRNTIPDGPQFEFVKVTEEEMLQELHVLTLRHIGGS